MAIKPRLICHVTRCYNLERRVESYHGKEGKLGVGEILEGVNLIIPIKTYRREESIVSHFSNLLTHTLRLPWVTKSLLNAFVSYQRGLPQTLKMLKSGQDRSDKHWTCLRGIPHGPNNTFRVMFMIEFAWLHWWPGSRYLRNLLQL